MIVQADVKAQRRVCDIHIAGITIKVAISNAERELPLPQRLTVVNSKQTCRSALRAPSAHRRRQIPGIGIRSRSLSDRKNRKNKNYECTKKHPSRESHRVPPAI